MAGITGPGCAVVCHLINKITYIHTYIHTYIQTYKNTFIHTFIPTYIHTYIHTVSLIPPREDQCEWHRMTRMTGPDCVVMCNLINTYIHTYISPLGRINASGIE